MSIGWRRGCSTWALASSSSSSSRYRRARHRGSRGPCQQPTSASVAIALKALSLFARVRRQAYTANLAAFLSTPQMGSFWSSMEEATADGAKICAHTMLEKTLTLRYPQTNFHWRFMDSSLDIEEGILTDGCDAFIMAMRDMQTDARIDQKRCDLGFVVTGVAVAELDVALPAQSEVADALSYWIKMMGDKNGTTYGTVQVPTSHSTALTLTRSRIP